MSVLDLVLVSVGVLGILIVALSARLQQWPVSEPLLALVAGVLLGPRVSGAIDLPSIIADPTLLHDPAEILLAISVMGVALRYPFGALRAQGTRLVIMLLVVMPLMALVSTGLAMGLLGMSLGASLLLGTALCPTDPVLASSVVTGKGAEQDLPQDDRQLLSLESGANDGLAFPLVLAAIAVAGPLGGRRGRTGGRLATRGRPRDRSRGRNRRRLGSPGKPEASCDRGRPGPAVHHPPGPGSRAAGTARGGPGSGSIGGGGQHPGARAHRSPRASGVSPVGSGPLSLTIALQP